MRISRTPLHVLQLTDRVDFSVFFLFFKNVFVFVFVFINPRRACAARVTVVVLCICMDVCMCVCPLIPAASHIGITKESYQRILRNTGIVLNFADFPKNASFKSYGIICLPRAAPAS